MSEGGFIKLDFLTELVIGAAINVHRHLGPGLLESAYQRCLIVDLIDRKLKFEVNKPLTLTYKSVRMEGVYKMDLVIDNLLVIELKSVERLEKVHTSQLLTYLKLGNYPVGLLLNFNVPIMRDGIRRITNNAMR